MSVLVDHNIEGQALLLLGTLQAQSWATLLDLRSRAWPTSGFQKRAPTVRFGASRKRNG